MEQDKASAADKKYMQAVEACKQLQDKYYDEEMPRVLEVEQKSLEHLTTKCNGNLIYLL
jgi:hypothetical protein